MGQSMSFNDDLIHSMKKMRLSNSNVMAIDNKNVVEVRILDFPSPSSPFRKQSAGEYDIMSHAVSAPFENTATLGSVDENIVANTNDYVESPDILMKLDVDTPVLDSKRNILVFFFYKIASNR